MKPIRLDANQPSRFYRGGSAIERFRGVSSNDEYVPEDWIGSTTAVFGEEPRGLTVLADGRLLRDAVTAEPEAFLGSAHVSRFGADSALLVKLLDAGERLPVHVHPDRTFAHEHLGARYGKSEAWLIVEAGGDRPLLYLGFREKVDLATLADWVARQDRASMLAALNELPVEPGDCVFVPGGTPHSIGKGVFMVEVQEPSDLGAMLDWSGFELGGPDKAEMGLGFDVALGCVRRTALGSEELSSWIRRSKDAPEIRAGARSVVPPEAKPFFRAEWLRPLPVVALEPSYAILVVVDGAGRLETEDGALDLARGETVLVPHAAGAGELSGSIEVVRCLPPLPEE